MKARKPEFKQALSTRTKNLHLFMLGNTRASVKQADAETSLRRFHSIRAWNARSRIDRIKGSSLAARSAARAHTPTNPSTSSRPASCVGPSWTLDVEPMHGFRLQRITPHIKKQLCHGAPFAALGHHAAFRLRFDSVARRKSRTQITNYVFGHARCRHYCARNNLALPCTHSARL